VERLDFFNSHYLKNYDTDALYNKLLTYLKRYDVDFYDLLQKNSAEYNKKILSELQTRIKHFSEYKSFSSLFYSVHKLATKNLFLNAKMKVTDEIILKKSLVL
jgi:glutamyl-tRNA synthetase/nondiscriminating glutamyl-tRNA synthetase